MELMLWLNRLTLRQITEVFIATVSYEGHCLSLIEDSRQHAVLGGKVLV